MMAWIGEACGWYTGKPPQPSILLALYTINGPASYLSFSWKPVIVNQPLAPLQPSSPEERYLYSLYIHYVIYSTQPECAFAERTRGYGVYQSNDDTGKNIFNRDVRSRPVRYSTNRYR